MAKSKNHFNNNQEFEHHRNKHPKPNSKKLIKSSKGLSQSVKANMKACMVGEKEVFLTNMRATKLKAKIARTEQRKKEMAIRDEHDAKLAGRSEAKRGLESQVSGEKGETTCKAMHARMG